MEVKILHSKLNIFNKLILSLLFSLITLSPTNYLLSEIKANNLDEEVNEKNEVSYQEEYILGPGDSLIIVFSDATEFSGQYIIGPDGLSYFPEIGALKTAELTIAELVQLLKQKYDEYLINPDFSIYLVSYRPVKTLLLGEVVRPGFYTLGGLSRTNTGPIRANSEADQKKLLNIVQASRTSEDLFPTLYDAIRLAGGITLYSDLKNIEVIRKNTLSNGGGNIKTNINLLSLLQDGDQSQNIRIYDGDTIIIKKSSEKIGKQIVQARKTNLNSGTISVYVGGNVKNPGKRVIPTGAGLNQAVELAGGRDLFSGNVAFIRFDNDGNIQKRNIRYNRNAKINSYKNPQLADGDIINVSDSILGKTTAVFGEIANPLVGAYGLYGIIEDILD